MCQSFIPLAASFPAAGRSTGARGLVGEEKLRGDSRVTSQSAQRGRPLRRGCPGEDSGKRGSAGVRGGGTARHSEWRRTWGEGCWHRILAEAGLRQSTVGAGGGRGEGTPHLAPPQPPPCWSRPSQVPGRACVRNARRPISSPLPSLSGTLLQKWLPMAPQASRRPFASRSRETVSKSPLKVSWQAWPCQGKGLVLPQGCLRSDWGP